MHATQWRSESQSLLATGLDMVPHTVAERLVLVGPEPP